jgi:hypothetical protein
VNYSFNFQKFINFSIIKIFEKQIHHGHLILKRETNAEAMATNPIAQTAMNKHKLNEEFNEKVGEMRDGCFPRPRGIGCRCVVKDAEGHDLERIFNSNEECKVCN